jgi:hypothetical protein
MNDIIFEVEGASFISRFLTSGMRELSWAKVTLAFYEVYKGKMMMVELKPISEDFHIE